MRQAWFRRNDSGKLRFCEWITWRQWRHGGGLRRRADCGKLGTGECNDTGDIVPHPPNGALTKEKRMTKEKQECTKTLLLLFITYVLHVNAVTVSQLRTCVCVLISKTLTKFSVQLKPPNGTPCQLLNVCTPQKVMVQQWLIKQCSCMTFFPLDTSWTKPWEQVFLYTHTHIHSPTHTHAHTHTGRTEHFFLTPHKKETPDPILEPSIFLSLVPLIPLFLPLHNFSSFWLFASFNAWLEIMFTFDF